MIQDVDNTLQHLLAEELSRIPGCPIYDAEQITFDAPEDADSAQDAEARVNLFLCEVRENMDMREQGFVRRPAEPDQSVGTQHASIRMDLTYLLTTHAGDEPRVEHRVLSDAMTVLMRYGAVPERYYRGSLVGQEANAVLMAVAQPEHLDMLNSAGIMQGMRGSTRAGLTLVITAPFNPFDTKWTRAVREATLAFGPGSPSEGMRGAPELAKKRVCAAGIVADQESEAPLPGVEVVVDGQDAVTVTDERGLFSFTDLMPGQRIFTFAKRNYRTQEAQATVPPPNRANQVEPLVIALRRLSDEERAAANAARAETARNAPGVADAGRTYKVSLSGMLRLADGAPAAYVPVRVADKRTNTDADGVYFFFDIPAGEHTVYAEMPGLGEVEVPKTNSA